MAPKRQICAMRLVPRHCAASIERANLTATNHPPVRSRPSRGAQARELDSSTLITGPVPRPWLSAGPWSRQGSQYC